MKRLFVSIDPPQSVRKVLVALDPHIRGVRWTPAAQIHLTLGFFPDVPEDVDLALREKLEAIEFRAFFLPVEEIGTFPPKGPVKIIWIGVGAGHPHLFQLHKRVRSGVPSWHRAGIAIMASAFHTRALSRCFTKRDREVFAIQCAHQCGDVSR